MPNHEVVLTRDELYQLVWAEPMVHVAKRFGLSDRGLAKLCARNDVPAPPRGWWARKRHGHAVRRTPLPQPESAADEIFIYGEPQREPMAADPPELLRERMPEWKIVVPQDLPVTNRVVKATGAAIRRSWRPRREAPAVASHAAEAKPTEFLSTTVLSKALLPRALRIWQALFDAFDRRSYTVSFDANGQTLVSVLGEPFELTLLEPQKQVFVESRWGSGRSMELHPSGRLFLRVGGSYSSSGAADKTPYRVEDRLNRFVGGLVRRALKAKHDRAVTESVGGASKMTDVATCSRNRSLSFFGSATSGIWRFDGLKADASGNSWQRWSGRWRQSVMRSVGDGAANG